MIKRPRDLFPDMCHNKGFTSPWTTHKNEQVQLVSENVGTFTCSIKYDKNYVFCLVFILHPLHHLHSCCGIWELSVSDKEPKNPTGFQAPFAPITLYIFTELYMYMLMLYLGVPVNCITCMLRDNEVSFEFEFEYISRVLYQHYSKLSNAAITDRPA